MKRAVIDTNVFVSALLSKRGVSFKLLSLVGTERFDICISVALVLEYEDVAKRFIGTKIGLSVRDIDNIIDYICSVAYHHRIYYLWRPTLKDPHDDMLLELAVSSECQYIITYNLRDFHGIEKFGIHPIQPREFLKLIGELS
jgi:putative PIN family toxin of toxin-antitoxin system